MKLSTIKNLLNKTISFQDFKQQLFEEMKEYRSLSRKKGTSMPVYVTEDTDLFIGKNELQVLCNAFLSRELFELEINYVADALLLSDRVFFESDFICNNIEYLTDPEINGALTDRYIQDILECSS